MFLTDADFYGVFLETVNLRMHFEYRSEQFRVSIVVVRLVMRTPVCVWWWLGTV